MQRISISTHLARKKRTGCSGASLIDDVGKIFGSITTILVAVAMAALGVVVELVEGVIDAVLKGIDSPRGVPGSMVNLNSAANGALDKTDGEST